MPESRFHLNYLLVSVADIEHVFVWWERYGITINVVQIPEISYPANKYLFKFSNGNPNTRCKIYKS